MPVLITLLVIIPLTTVPVLEDSLTQDQLFARGAPIYVKLALLPITAHLASQPITELSSMDNVSVLQDSIKL